MNVETRPNGKKGLPIMDVEAELRRFEEEERRRLGIEGASKAWVEDMANLTFTKAERSKITLLIGGLTMAHDFLAEAAFRGVGYNVQMLSVPTNAALNVGKEFGNRGQCNPTYFTVGNLVEYLIALRDKHGMSSKEIVEKFVFLTAGACGPCRFGMYVTEYRKALRDAGFDGFRVVLFQQTGGFQQATGEESGLELNPTFFTQLAKAVFAGDVLNLMGYRLRPYEKNVGDTDRAIEAAKKICHEALSNRASILLALWKCRPLFANLEIDRTIVKPKVSIIGEFWAMTTEGDGNYQLQRFLESEGAEADIQIVAAWILYNIWESRRDTLERRDLRGADNAMYGLGALGTWGVAARLAKVAAAEYALRGAFQVMANITGLHGYKLPDMDYIAAISHEYYNNDLRGGEGHMEVGKLIMNVTQSKSHMTLSVKPFGCMPSAGVSDGVQTAITEKFPGTIFCPVETSGDGRVNFYSRVQMYLFKAKQAAVAEYDRVCEENGVTREQVAAFLEANPRFRHPLHHPAHHVCGTNADLVVEVAPYITKTPWQRAQARVGATATKAIESARVAPSKLVGMVKGVTRNAPVVAGLLKEDVVAFLEERKKSRPGKGRSSEVVHVEAAAE